MTDSEINNKFETRVSAGFSGALIMAMVVGLFYVSTKLLDRIDERINAVNKRLDALEKAKP